MRITQSQIKSARARHGLTVAQLAERVGVSPRTVEGWEQGRAISGPARLLLSELFKPKKKGTK